MFYAIWGIALGFGSVYNQKIGVSFDRKRCLGVTA